MPELFDGKRGMKPKSVELAIHELVLHGIDRRDQQRVGEALRRELMQLLSERGLPPGFETGADIRYLKVGTVRITKDLAPEAMGARTARAVFGALRR